MIERLLFSVFSSLEAIRWSSAARTIRQASAGRVLCVIVNARTCHMSLSVLFHRSPFHRKRPRFRGGNSVCVLCSAKNNRRPVFRLLFQTLAVVASLCCSSLTLRAADPVSPRNANGSITKAALQPDGKVIVVGNFSYIGHFERAGIARLNADGTLDTTFDPGEGGNRAINL